jgi:hypothetical protein
MKTLTLILVATIAAASSAWCSDARKSTNATEDCCNGAACSALISSYEKVSTALAADNLKDAQTAATDLGCWAKCQGHADLVAKIEGFTKSAALADARKLFKEISAATIPLAEKAGAHYVMTCPMAGADWMQTTATVANPYYGSQMLHCGAIKKTIKGDS